MPEATVGNDDVRDESPSDAAHSTETARVPAPSIDLSKIMLDRKKEREDRTCKTRQEIAELLAALEQHQRVFEDLGHGILARARQLEDSDHHVAGELTEEGDAIVSESSLLAASIEEARTIFRGCRLLSN